MKTPLSLQEKLTIILNACQTADPTVPDALVMETFSSLTDQRMVTRLVSALKDRPDLLVSGFSGMLPSTVKLVRLLRDNGHLQFLVPRCAGCDAEVPLAHHDGHGGKVCSNCCRNMRNRPCTACGQMKPGGYRMLKGEPFCRACFVKDPRSQELCRVCQQLGVPLVRDQLGIVCQRCYAGPPATCGKCGKFKTVGSLEDGVPLCRRCYQTLRRYPRHCAGCGTFRVCPYFREGEAICPECAGSEGRGRCAECGATDRALNGRRCSVCMIPAKVRALITDSNGEPHPALLPLEAYLLRNEASAEATYKWCYHSPMSKIVREMALGQREISLTSVAELPQTNATGYLAAMLVESGVLPPENFALLRLKVWEGEKFLQVRNPSMMLLLRQYAVWSVNPSFAEAKDFEPAAENGRLSRAKSHLLQVIDWLNYIDELGYDLTTVPQRIFDQYVSSRGRNGFTLTPFIRWARQRKATKLRALYLQSLLLGPVVSDDQRWAWIKFLIHTDDIRIAARVAGLFCLVYGVQLSKVMTLRTEDITANHLGMHVTFGRDPVQVPETIGALINELLTHRPGPNSNESGWLFKGKQPGHHLTSAAVAGPLNAAGINLKEGRSVALMTMAQEVPPSILSDLLGISIEAASRWSALSSHDWIDYPRLRLDPLATAAPRNRT